MFKNSVLLFSIFSSFVTLGQGIINEEAGVDITNSFNSNQQELNYFSQQSNNSLNKDDITVANSGIFINQIGDNNITNVRTQSQTTDIQLNQIGDFNSINLDLNADVIDYQVIQQGVYNRLSEFQTFSGKQLIERNVIQNGNNQNLIIHGRNGIVDKMKINMEGSSQNVIIRNTN